MTRMFGNRSGLLPAAALALALGACAGGEPGSKDRRLFGLKVEPPPLDTRPGDKAQRKRPGLVSGDAGALTLYRKHDRGSADPAKPEKVKR